MTDTRAKRNWQQWVGYGLTGLASAALVMSASMKLSHGEEVVKMFTGHFGYPESSLVYIGIAELTCVALYLFPRTSVLGAILIAAYLGGAVATHVRAGEAFVAPIVVAVLAWGGLFLREPRLRALIPLRKP